jgi:hypothetical protein
MLMVSQSTWATVLERWERGDGITVLLPLSTVEPDPVCTETLRHVKDARQKVDGADLRARLPVHERRPELLRRY